MFICIATPAKRLFERMVRIANINQLARPSVTTFGGGQHHARAPPNNDAVGRYTHTSVRRMMMPHMRETDKRDADKWRKAPRQCRNREGELKCRHQFYLCLHIIIIIYVREESGGGERGGWYVRTAVEESTAATKREMDNNNNMKLENLL